MDLRSELPRPIPAVIESLPRERGYPVPWFVGWVDEDGNAVPRGQGTADFRVIYPGAIPEAMERSICWICGLPLQRTTVYAFVVGPMCAVNRTSAEPPSHVACADWSARACPFLSRPHMDRREHNLPKGEIAGIPIKRNPGVALVWLSRNAHAWTPPDGGILFNIGDPAQVRFYCEGRKATREEVLMSIETGLPFLQEIADEQGDGAPAALAQQVETAMALLPA
jgi:hypothetical protein